VSKTKFGLGKGLGALLPSASDETPQEISVVPTSSSRDDGISVGVLAHIEVSRISPNPYQPRTEFDPQALLELAQSIRENGLVQPVTVRRHDGAYQLISGERRVRACQEAGIEHIPAYIRKVETVEEMIELALIENIQRETLNPIEIAQSYKRLMDECNHTQDQIATKVGKSRATVANFVRLLRLPREIQDSIQKSEISYGHARALINLPDANAQMRIWKKIVREGLPVRRAEELAREATQPVVPVAPKKKKSDGSENTPFESVNNRLRGLYGSKIEITATKAGKGSISIEFYSHDDFERVVELLLR
jgi:ParB family chromosome partitioning protein